MTREEIEQIIRENIRTNGRGEITAKVMAGVLESFVNYTDTQAEDFAELCRQLAAAFNALVVEMEGRFETKAEALEAAMEAFCSDLLNNHFIPWAEGLAGSLSDKMDLTKEAAEAARAAALEAKAASLEGKAAAIQAGAKADDAKTAALDAKDAALNARTDAALAAEKSTAAKAAIDSAADGIAEALNIIRLGNQEVKIVVPNGLKFGNSSLTEYPASQFDFSNVQNWGGMFLGNMNLENAPAVHATGTCGQIFSNCTALRDVSEIVIEASGQDPLLVFGALEYGFSNCTGLVEIPEGVISVVADSNRQLNYAFSGCSNLERVTITVIKGTVGTINLWSTFAWCSKLEDFTFVFAGEDNNVKFDAYETFQGCTALQAIPRSFLERCELLRNFVPQTLISLPGFDASGLSGWVENRTNIQLTNIGPITNLNPGSLEIRGYKLLTLASLQNIVNGLVENFYSKPMSVSQESLAIMQADTTEYTYNGNTYIGLIALANAKNWTVTA